MLNQFEESLKKNAKPVFFTDHNLIKQFKHKYSAKNNSSLFKNKQSRNDKSANVLSRPLLSNNNYSKIINYPYSSKAERDFNQINGEKILSIPLNSTNSNRESKEENSSPNKKVEKLNDYNPQTTCSDGEICKTEGNLKEFVSATSYSKSNSIIYKDLLSSKKIEINILRKIQREKLMENIKLNDDYDIYYNQQVSPEEQDKVYLDDLKTSKFKQSVKSCLKGELIDSFKLDQFYSKTDNKVNFIFDNFYVPHFKNKLYVTSTSKV